MHIHAKTIRATKNNDIIRFIERIFSNYSIPDAAKSIIKYYSNCFHWPVYIVRKKDDVCIY